MFEKFGRRKYALPFLIPILLIGLFSLMFYPMANMQMKHLPFAVVSLDEGADLPTGSANIGKTMVEALKSGDASAFSGAEDGGDGNSPSAIDMSEAIDWTVLSSEDELEERLADNEFYGAIVIPKDFTLVNAATQMKKTAAENALEASMAQAEQLAAAQAAAEQAQTQGAASDAQGPGIPAGPQAQTATQTQTDPATVRQAQVAAAQMASMRDIFSAAENVDAADSTLRIYLDKGKSPLIAQQMQSSMASIFAAQGISAEVELVNDGGYESSSAAMGTMMSQQLAILPAILCGFAVALVSSRVLNVRAAVNPKRAFGRLGAQIALQAAISALVAACAWLAVDAIAGMEMPFGSAFGFLWLATFFMMLLFGGISNVALPLGAIAAITTLGLGNMLGVLPFEALPAFWQNWVFPWAPQRFIGEGVRAVTYMGAGAFNEAVIPLALAAVIGLMLSLLTAMLPKKSAQD